MRTQSAAGLVLGLLFAASSYGLPQSSPVAQTAGRQVTIRVRNYARVKFGLLLKAERVTAGILQGAGVSTVWLACWPGDKSTTDAACANKRGPMHLTLNILPRSMSHRYGLASDVLGTANPIREGFASDAWIFYDRVIATAVQQQLDFAQLLGNLMAHELGHLLLRDDSHSQDGIMRAVWSGEVLIAVGRRQLPFSASECQRIQKELDARLHMIEAAEWAKAHPTEPPQQ